MPPVSLTMKSTTCSEKTKDQPNGSRITRFLHVVEWLGNALPHPVTLFALFALGVVVLSGILGYFDVSVIDPRPEGAKGRADNGLIEVVSLMNADGLEADCSQPRQ